MVYRERIGPGWFRLIISLLVLSLALFLTACQFTAWFDSNTVLLSPTDTISNNAASDFSGLWTLEELVHAAQGIAVGKVLATHCFEADGLIFTDVLIEVEEALKGSPPYQVTVRTVGGEIGNVVLWVSHEPRFTVGERTLLFLDLESIELPYSAGRYGVVGGFKGKLTIKDGRVVEMSLSEEEVVSMIRTVLRGEHISVEPQFIPMDSDSYYDYGFFAGLSPLGPYSYDEWRWPQTYPLVSYYINPSGIASNYWTYFIDAIKAAHTTWNAAGSNLLFSYAGTTSRTVRQDGYNVVEARSSFGRTSWMARTLVWAFKRGSGNNNYYDIFECDMQFNLYYRWAIGSVSGYYDVQNVATHEFGHFLKLNDLYRPLSSEATMYGYIATGETKKRTLEFEDIGGILGIYGFRL